MNFQLTDTAAACAVAKYCASALSLNSTTSSTQGSYLAAAGTGTVSQTIDASATNLIAIGYELVIPAGTLWITGNWVVRLDVTVANSNITWAELLICQISSACSNISTIADTNVSLGLGSTGVKSQAVGGSAVASPASTDKVFIVLSFTNGKSSAQAFTWKKDVLIDSPFVFTSDWMAAGQTQPVIEREGMIPY